MRLDIMEGGQLRHVPIREGEMFLLPARVPHSPQVRSLALSSLSTMIGRWAPPRWCAAD
jgi:uncharacterized RmlC-like cupin family protein